WQDSRRSRRLRPGNLPTYRAGRNRDLRIVANALRLTHIAACHHVQLFTIFSEPNRSCHLRPALAKRRERDVFSAANCKRNCPGHETIVATKSLGLAYGSNGHFHAGDSNRMLRALPRWRVRRKPLNPLFIHSGEVCFLKKDDSGTHDPFEGSARGFQDGRDILQALSGLLLDRIPDDLPGYWIVRPRA